MAKSSKPAFFSSRREMLKAAAGCSLMTNTSLLSTFLTLQATKAVASSNTINDYKAIVCLFLFGGNDSYNMMTPYDGSGSGDASDPNNPNISGEYGDYYRVRGGYDDGILNPGGLALERSTLTPIADPVSGRNFGLHPGMSADADPNANPDPALRGVAGLYNDGKLGFVANVGSLIERTTKTTYQQRVNLPLGLFSHADLQRHWMSGVPQSRNQLTGWGGRIADCLQSTNSEPTVSMNISIGGVNLFQAGANVTPYAIGSNGATVVSNYFPDYDATGNYQNKIFSRATDNVLGQTYNDLLEASFAATHRNSIDAAIAFNDGISGVNINTTFADEGLSNRFKTIAKVIGAAGGPTPTLAQKRQVFFISEGGWDNHGDVLPAQQNKLPVVSRALTSFYAAMEELGLQDSVVTFTASDFARTLGSNGQGSDHAWGGNQIVMGGQVAGGKVFGEYPLSLAAGNDLDLGRGRLIPKISVDEFAADLALWFGLSNSDLDLVLPNIRTFYDGTGSPLGIMA